jgi:uncharacterized protein YdeI (YjbR/CyaY-like superfamily)
VADELEVLVVGDARAWRRWLGRNHARDAGVWLTLAKKGSRGPTTLTYDDALEEALCHGWIDGQVQRNDEHTYHQRFTPRRQRSSWSQRNVGLVQRLQKEGRMRPAGLQAVAAAKADGRWQSAYAGAASIEVPADLAAALATEPKAAKAFAALSAQNRYAILYRVHEAKRAQTRAQRIERFTAMLARGETPHPQKARSEKAGVAKEAVHESAGSDRGGDAARSRRS